MVKTWKTPEELWEHPAMRWWEAHEGGGARSLVEVDDDWEFHREIALAADGTVIGRSWRHGPGYDGLSIDGEGTYWHGCFAWEIERAAADLAPISKADFEAYWTSRPPIPQPPILVTDLAGDVSLFPSVSRAESYMEAIDVRANEYASVLDRHGLVLCATAMSDSAPVHVEVADPPRYDVEGLRRTLANAMRAYGMAELGTSAVAEDMLDVLLAGMRERERQRWWRRLARAFRHAFRR